MIKDQKELKQDLDNYMRTKTEYFIKRVIKPRPVDLYFYYNANTGIHSISKSKPTTPHLQITTINQNIALESFVQTYLHSEFHGRSGLDLKTFVLNNYSTELISKWIRNL